jgi:alkylation response protein AidB-like acyl-CoA dehydrogenase
MHFGLTEDQRAMEAAVRQFAEREIGPAVVRAAAESADGVDWTAWRRSASLGWLGVGAPATAGGLALAAVELAVVARELGYANAPLPFVSTAAYAIPALGALGADDLVARVLADGLAVAVVEDPEWVADATGAGAFLAIDGGVVTWHERDEVTVTPRDSLDRTRRLASVRLGAGQQLGPAHAVAPARLIAVGALSAEIGGGLQWMLDRTVEYATSRVQFGRPIGAFQAVKHHLADVLIRTESSRSIAFHAAWAAAVGAPDAEYLASVAKAYCSEAALFVAGRSLQLHGGVGFTWEHDLQFWYKRALTNAVLLGDAREHGLRALALDPGIAA